LLNFSAIRLPSKFTIFGRLVRYPYDAMNPTELQRHVRSHAAWLNGLPGGRRLDLHGVDLAGADFPVSI